MSSFWWRTFLLAFRFNQFSHDTNNSTTVGAAGGRLWKYARQKKKPIKARREEDYSSVSTLRELHNLNFSLAAFSCAKIDNFSSPWKKKSDSLSPRRVFTTWIPISVYFEYFFCALLFALFFSLIKRYLLGARARMRRDIALFKRNENHPRHATQFLPRPLRFLLSIELLLLKCLRNINCNSRTVSCSLAGCVRGEASKEKRNERRDKNARRVFRGFAVFCVLISLIVVPLGVINYTKFNLKDWQTNMAGMLNFQMEVSAKTVQSLLSFIDWVSLDVLVSFRFHPSSLNFTSSNLNSVSLTATRRALNSVNSSISAHWSVVEAKSSDFLVLYRKLTVPSNWHSLHKPSLAEQWSGALTRQLPTQIPQGFAHLISTKFMHFHFQCRRYVSITLIDSFSPFHLFFPQSLCFFF